MGRSPCCEKEHTNKGAWAKEEDERLINYIKLHGESCWRSLPKAAGLLRCGKSCRLRWINYLRPDLKRGNFTEDEDELIINLHSLLGNKWSLIAARLPGRTDNEIKNYWNTHIKKKLCSRGIDPQTHRPLNSTSTTTATTVAAAAATTNNTNTSTSNKFKMNNEHHHHHHHHYQYYSSLTAAADRESNNNNNNNNSSGVTTEEAYPELNLELSIGLPVIAQKPRIDSCIELFNDSTNQKPADTEGSCQFFIGGKSYNTTADAVQKINCVLVIQSRVSKEPPSGMQLKQVHVSKDNNRIPCRTEFVLTHY